MCCLTMAAQAGMASAMASHDEEKLMLFAARALQAAWRGRQARAEVQTRKSAITLIQAGFRGKLARCVLGIFE